MAIFVDLDDDDIDLPQQGHNGIKPVWTGMPPSEPLAARAGKEEHSMVSADNAAREEAAHEPAVQEEPNSVTVALGCYP